jgi:RTX calcium-binding nonapeptide repeat (4 copies)
VVKHNSAPHRRSIAVPLVAIVSAWLISVGATPAAAQPVLDANCPEPSDAFLTLQANERRAQTFTAQNTGSLIRGEFLVNKSTGSGDFVMQVVAAPSGTPTDPVLASATIADASVPATGTTNPVRIAGTFGTPASVVAGQGYALVISRPGATAFVHERGDFCPGRQFDSTAGGPWTPTYLFPPEYDAIFAVYVSPPAPPAPIATCKGKQATIVGTSGSDGRKGTSAKDVIVGLGGNDKLSGVAGNDLICGGKGADVLMGGPGSDFLSGQKGNDKLFGGKDNDKLSGKAGKDTLKGGPGKDKLKGGAGRDKEVQ